jgi:protein-disulfide isomerase
MALESRHDLGPRAVALLLALSAAVAGGALFTACSSGSSNSTQSPGGGSSPVPGAGGTLTVVPTPKTVEINVGDNPYKGPADAKVTIVEFADFQGPNCGRFATQTLPQILSNYGDKVRFVFINFPLKKDNYAQKAAEAGECANAQGAFWQYHDLLFQNQQVLTALLTPDPAGGLAKVAESLKGYAAQLGLDTAKFNDCLDSGKMTSAVQADGQVSQKAIQDAGLTSHGLPAFFINGNYLGGAKAYAVFKQLIDAALAAAK